MNKKVIIGLVAIVSISTLAIGQSYAANSSKITKASIEQVKKGKGFGSGNLSGLHLGSGMKIRGTGDKPEGRSGLKLGSGNKIRSGDKKHFGSGFRLGSGNKIRSGEKEHIGSGFKFGSADNNTGKVDNITNKISKFSSTFENMEDDKLKEILTRVETMISKTTKTATLTFLNAIKALIQGNIGN